jgi:thiol-disulfide isomerase/thioredoxin
MRSVHELVLLVLLIVSTLHFVSGAIAEKPEETTTTTIRSDTVSDSTASESSVDLRGETAATQESKATKDETYLEVIQLTSRNFSKHISDGSIWLIEFYSPKCGYCVEFAPTYADIARHYHSKTGNKKQRSIKVGKVNGEIEVALISRFAIDGYPSFFIVDGWSVYKFEDARYKKQLMAFADGGYKKNVSIPFYSSPMGPLGMFQGVLMFVGHTLSDVFEWAQHTFGLSPLLVGMILFGSMFMGCFFLIVMIALVIPERPKRD